MQECGNVEMQENNFDRNFDRNFYQIFYRNFDRNFDRYFDKMVTISFGGGGGKTSLGATIRIRRDI